MIYAPVIEHGAWSMEHGAWKEFRISNDEW